MKKQIHNLTLLEVLKKYNSNEQGISELEAKERIKKHGLNEIKKKHTWKWARIIFSQFNDALVWILLVAAFLAFLFSEYRDVTIILIIVFINASIGFFQEFKAERVLDSIKKLTKEKAIVFRDGEKKEINAKFVVSGDVIFVSSGDNIPADGYILESYDLKVNNFIFTGETKPKRKEKGVLEENKIALADIINMVFMGETVSTGEAKILVVKTGMDTELGKIADTVQTVKDDPTPLQAQMRTLGKDVTILAVLIGILVMIGGQYFKMSLYQNFLFALALAVSVVPEGLPAAISVALSLGMKRLLKDNVLAKKLNAVETLGSVSIICTDKTGTITKNELTVTKIFINDETIDVSGTGYEPKGDFLQNKNTIEISKVSNAEMLFKIGTLCNDATLKKNKKTYSIIGDPTEGAIIVAGQKFNSEKGFFQKNEQKITENPFSSERMRMSVIFKKDKTISYVKGSPDVLLDLCSEIKIGENILPFSEAEKEKIKKVYNSMSEEALRVLAFAYKNLDNIKDEAEKDLIWVGMMAMIDPPRPDVAEAIGECKKLGINPIMITGDYEITARAIAKKAGLISEKEKKNNLVINGKDLDNLNDREVYKKIKNGVCVFARIAPEQKLRIATILKKYGEVIAMTGDGVNDAPALKKADIGVAMGIIGTDVSKEASDMILMDDNFASIVKGVREGRTIFSNLKKFVHYVFTSNASELFTVIFGVILQIPSPLSAVQILAVDLGTDIFPSFSLSLEPQEPRAKEEKNARKKPVMDFLGFRRILYLGIIMAVGAVVAFIWSMLRGGWHFGGKIDTSALLYIKSTTAAYAVLSMTQMANLLQSRSATFSPFQLGFFKNKYAIGAIGISIFMLLAFMYIPIFQKYLHMAPIDLFDWIAVAISVLAVFYWEEIRKGEGK
ncbi:MAG TPA: cation-transporting P-type ATPase [Candidatus Moranbacteria bacterium]|nr:cation-transporting P-type ATPase [Candidatus Moranbacteria bacterium]